MNRLGYSQISVLTIKYTKEQKIEGEKYKITAPTKLAQKNSLVIKINFNKAILQRSAKMPERSKENTKNLPKSPVSSVTHFMS